MLMKLICFEEEAFREMLNKLVRLSEHAARLRKRHAEKGVDEWIDSQDVCLLLDVSLRTLQTYRETGILGYSQISHKTYYRQKDVMQLLHSNMINTKEYGNECKNEG